MATKAAVSKNEIEDVVVEALHDEFVRGEFVQKAVQEALCDEFQCLQDMLNDLVESVHESLGVSHSCSSAPDSLADRLDRVEQVLAGWQWVNQSQYKAAAFDDFLEKAPLEDAIQDLQGKAILQNGPVFTDDARDAFCSATLERECNRRLLPRDFDIGKASKPERAAAFVKVARVGHVAEMTGIDIVKVARWYDEWLTTQAQPEAA